MIPAPLLSKRAVAEIVGVHETTIMRLAREGKFPAPIRTGAIGSAVRFCADDVNDWIEAKRGLRGTAQKSGPASGAAQAA